MLADVMAERESKTSSPERGKGGPRPEHVTEIGWSLVTFVTVWINVRVEQAYF